MSRHKGQFPLLVLLLLLAVVLRAVVVGRFAGNLNADIDQYLGIAQSLVNGNGFATPGTGVPTAFRPPLYSLLLAALIAVGGTPWNIGIVQIVLGTATVWLTVMTGRRLGLAYWSLLAGLIVAFDPLLLHHTTLVMTETLATFLAALLLWLAAGRTAPISARSRFQLGCVWGLCCLCRPTFFAFGGLVAAVEFARDLLRRGAAGLAARTAGGPQPTGTAGYLRELIAAGWPVALGAALVVAPWAIRNAVVIGRPIITTTHGGYTLLLAHNPVYYQEVVDQQWGAVWNGRSLNAWQAELESRLAAAGVQGEVARDRWMYDQAWSAIRRDPGHAFKAGVTLLGRFWNLAPLGPQSAALGRTGVGIIRLFYSLVLLGLALGIWRIIRENSDQQAGAGAGFVASPQVPLTHGRSRLIAWQPALLLILSFTLVHFLYWADMRMRAPLIPAIALIAARGLARMPNTASDAVNTRKSADCGA